jgi:fatty-acyl-CoA synthase
MPLVELRLIGDDGDELPWDGQAVGELEARGPCVISEYYEADEADTAGSFHDGWLRTGDLARVEPDGTVEIVDRAKDLVKSGGEWISSVELENAIAAHPAVIEAAVVAVPHPKWGERPLALVVTGADTSLSSEELSGFLVDRVAKWWIPERVELVAEIPKTPVGKYDKRRIRALYTTAAGPT